MNPDPDATPGTNPVWQVVLDQIDAADEPDTQDDEESA